MLADISTEAGDYTQTSVTLSIPAGDYTSPQLLNLPASALVIEGDLEIEVNETLSLTLQNPIGTPVAAIAIGDTNGDSITRSYAEYTIVNDDALVVELSAATGENPGHWLRWLVIIGLVVSGASSWYIWRWRQSV